MGSTTQNNSFSFALPDVRSQDQLVKNKTYTYICIYGNMQMNRNINA